MNYKTSVDVDVKKLFEDLSPKDQLNLIKELLSEFPEREIGEVISDHLELADTDRMIRVLEDIGYKVTENNHSEEDLEMVK